MQSYITIEAIFANVELQSLTWNFLPYNFLKVSHRIRSNFCGVFMRRWGLTFSSSPKKKKTFRPHWLTWRTRDGFSLAQLRPFRGALPQTVVWCQYHGRTFAISHEAPMQLCQSVTQSKSTFFLSASYLAPIGRKYFRFLTRVYLTLHSQRKVGAFRKDRKGGRSGLPLFTSMCAQLHNCLYKLLPI